MAHILYQSRLLRHRQSGFARPFAAPRLLKVRRIPYTGFASA
ncbi:hypothetical protein HMPREF9371_1203 [Neisseria shayeganii 871]|uniref:Uncharacterized protein n=1 Tax=Neisseria shayeganii 871 TaxID=1032488 RepID=G4CHW4_9NEIS|nr:hypothetical protein HMPREF9371_1203 [Neisseria shayeganii 871]